MKMQQIDTKSKYHKDVDIDKIMLLNQVIESFNCAADKFGGYYQNLEKRVSELDFELKKKNRELQDNLEEKEEIKKYLNNILESLTTGVIVFDLNGKIKTFNKAAEQITGFKYESVAGKIFDNVFNKYNFPQITDNINFLIKLNEKTEFEIEINRSKESLIHAGISVAPVYNINKKKIGTVMTIQDITGLKKLEDRVNRTDRLSAMGEMAVKIAHEIRNPLGSIELFTGILKKDLDEHDEIKTILSHISKGINSIDNIISNLLLFVKPDQQPYYKKVNIHESLEESLLFSHHLVNTDKSINVIKKFTSESLIINGDIELLKQVWLNIILNSVQAMPDGGKLLILSKKINDLKNKAGFAEVRIRDTGIGINKSNLSRIFDPFFTTKRRGTGLGLTIVHNILKVHRGTMDITCLNPGVECLIRIPLQINDLNYKPE